jgi:hypothetical protein
MKSTCECNGSGEEPKENTLECAARRNRTEFPETARTPKLFAPFLGFEKNSSIL